MDLLDSHLLKHLSLDCSIEAVLFKGKSLYLFWSISDVEFFKHGPRFLLVEMVNDEKISDVLALGHRQPIAATRMTIEIRAEIV